MRPKSIRVVAVPGVLAPRPRHGGRDPYFARGTDDEANKAGRHEHDSLHPVLKEGEEVPSFPLDIFLHAVRYVKEAALLPADTATAQYCDVKASAKDAPKPAAK
jgi:hypothetical protein